MGMTIIEKIFARKAGLDTVSAGDTVVVDVDMTVLIDLQFATMWIEPLRIHDPDKLAIVMDHAVPAPTIKDAAGGSHARKFAAEFGIERFYDVGRHGICHQVIAENGLARPGEILACTDSHTCAAGAYNTAARGLGPAEVYSIMCTGSTWFQVAPTIRYQLEGVKPDTVSGKDIFLHIANEYGDAANLNLEFGGPGLASIPMHDRRTIATQGAEVSADFSTFEPDEVLTSFLDERGVTGYDAAGTGFRRGLPRGAARGPGRTGTLRGPAGHREPQRPAGLTVGQAENRPGLHRVVRQRPTRRPRNRCGHIARQHCCARRPTARHTGVTSRLSRGDAARLPAGHRRRGRGDHQLHLWRLLRIPHGRGRTRRSVFDVKHSQLHRSDGQPRGADLHGLTGDRRRIGDHRLYHRREECDRMTLAITGKVWVFGDDLNTDAMYPAFAMKMDPPEAAKHIFYEVRPGWTDQVSPGDIVVAGKNFGLGSSRPVAALFAELGVAGLVAEEFNSLFFRNAVNAGLPAMTVPEATTVFSEGDTGTFDLSSGEWRNETTGASGSVPRLPDLILDIISSGGVLPRLAAQGYLPAELGDVLRSSTVAIRGAGSGA